MGDAGAPRESEAALAALERDAGERRRLLGSTRTAIAFLGDNIYPRGLPDPVDEGFGEARRRIDAQIALVRRARARGFLVPGNHDWANGGATGWEAIRRLEWYARKQGGASVRVVPSGGCPGPESRELGLHLRLVFLDTQWWLHHGPKPRDPDSSCPADSEQEVITALAQGLARSDGRRTIVLAHHPLRSGGPHGGYFPWLVHLFPLHDADSRLWVPLPGLGSLVALGRQLGFANQDLAGSDYRRLRRALETAFASTPPLVYAAGHDHSLQVIEGRRLPYLLVSGAGNADGITRVRALRESLLARSAPGYMRLEALEDGRVRLVTVALDGRRKAQEIFRACLDEPCRPVF